MTKIQDKQNFREGYIRDYKRLTGITDLTGQDVYGALVLMTRRGTLETRGRSLWSKSQWEYLYRKMLDTADPYNDTIELFRQAVSQTRYDRKHRYHKTVERQSPKDGVSGSQHRDASDTDCRAPEEDMQTVSDELLRQDDVFYS